jgi:Protein of Unknown function (DUF2784)
MSDRLFRVAATGVMLLHFAFVLFVVVGGLVLQRWPRLLPLHLLAAATGLALERLGLTCPLTQLEQDLLGLAGRPAYSGSFLQQYLAGLAPGPWTAAHHWLELATFLLNAVVYLYVIERRWPGRHAACMVQQPDTVEPGG